VEERLTVPAGRVLSRGGLLNFCPSGPSLLLRPPPSVPEAPPRARKINTSNDRISLAHRACSISR